MLAVWAVSTLTMLVLAGALPDFRLQSESDESVTQIAVTAALGAGAFGLLSSLVWPLLVRALLLVPALVLGLLVFFLNGSLLLLALRLNPSGQGAAAPETAVVVAAVMSAVASATGGALAVRDDDAYRRRLYRLADRRRGHHDGRPGPAGPGTVFLQLDGVGHDVLEAATEKGLMPTVAEWLGLAPPPASAGTARPRPTHRLTPWRTDWSSQTGASQLGILHGTNHDVPAFRWYEKDTREVMVCNRPSSAAELQRRAVERTGDGGLLTVDGASRGNLFSGGAEQLALVLSMAARRGRRNRSRAGYFAYFSDPANAVRTAMSFAADVLREIGQSTRARFAEQRPRVKRGGLYPFIRAFATVVERDVVVSAVIGDMFAGRAAIYADLVAYDEVAHHSGPHSRDAAKILQRLDRSLALIAQVAEHAPRAYRIVLLSDHGQSPGETFLGRYGLTLGDLVRAGCGLPVPRRAQRTHSGAEARAAVRAALRIPVEEGVEEHRPTRRSEPVTLASGNLGLVSFPDVSHRMSREEIDARHPALLSTLANHPGIGFVLVRSEEHGGVVLGAHGAEIPIGELSDEHPGPLADFGPGAADAVRRTHGFPHTADIMVNSWYDPTDGEVLAFEEQIGSHGGLGGCQSRPFLMSPLALSEPTEDDEPLVGAEHIHRVLRRWLREANGPQVPLADESAPLRGAGNCATGHDEPTPAPEQNPADA
ncbi:phage holin family protein [Streptomyces caniscabiei]|uniref:phage holin family protein n=1 Tax=Streptomyces caniscabiei TaxID=2746961 RepID=UPI0029B7F36E|nr:phage holin family protein [Streptomyces caniscabiei]MDX2603709.1 phage holin family protein [Streptomyces caniscabiei]MDX2738759.1 phage holin family protein [Streptomyces caniscabiei]MDX2778232.1 phage holin family protein [Streptomyces caniscabiei]